MKNIVKFIIISLVFLTFSCSKPSVQTDDNSYINLEVKKSEAVSVQVFNSQFTYKKILVVLGYDVNSPKISSELKTQLQNLYGLTDANGINNLVTYPEDFKRGQRGYIGEFTAMLTDTEVEYAGVIILGAPEYTHIALARHQDFWNQKVPYPTIALFPQDDILGIEANCDIVIEKAQPLQMDGEPLSEEVENQLIEEAPNLLIHTINYFLYMDESNTCFERTESLKNHLNQMYPEYKFHNYSDPETGLQSINHFILN